MGSHRKGRHGMTEKQLADLGFNAEAIRRILEIIAEGQEGQEGRKHDRI